jgi:hypothetical protein
MQNEQLFVAPLLLVIESLDPEDRALVEEEYNIPNMAMEVDELAMDEASGWGSGVEEIAGPNWELAEVQREPSEVLGST